MHINMDYKACNHKVIKLKNFKFKDIKGIDRFILF